MKNLFVVLIVLLTQTYSFTQNSYYVSGTGDDTNPGTESQPWRHIQYAADNITAGDTVYIFGGTYSEKVTINNLSATSSNYSVFTNHNNGIVTIDGNGINIPDWEGVIYINNCDYLILDSLKIINAEEAGIMAEHSDFINIENCTTYNTNSSGIQVRFCTNIIVDNNKIERASLGNQGGSSDVQECLSIVDTDDFEIKNNTVFDNDVDIIGGEGIDIKDGCKNGKVYKNKVYDLDYDLGIYIDAYSKLQENIEIYNNEVYNCTNGIALSTEDSAGKLKNIDVYNNVVYDNSKMGIILSAWEDDGPKENIQIRNNTIYHNGQNEWWGGGIFIETTNILSVEIINNICSENLAWQIAVNTMDNITVDHNLINPFNGYNDPEAVEVKGTNYIEANPQFENTTNKNFHLKNNSPCIDAAFNNNLTYDNENAPRPLISNIDMGAYEYGIYWTGSISNNWNTTGNWSNNLVPISTDTVTIPPSNFYVFPPEINTNTQVKKVFFNGNGQLQINQNTIFNIGN